MHTSIKQLAAACVFVFPAAALAIPEGPEPNTAAWLQRETLNYAHVLEAPAEETQSAQFLAVWTLRGLTNHNEWLMRGLNDPSWLSPLSGNTAITPVAATWGAVATGDPTRYPDADGPNGRVFYEQEAEVIPVVYYDDGCARISGRVWAPRGWQLGDALLPGVVIENGSIQASETLYWFVAQPLVRAGYVVMSFDPRGQGRSDLMTPSGEQGGNIKVEVFKTGMVNAIDFFRSSPAVPYVHNKTCEGSYPTEVAPFNPLYERLDLTRLGIAGHSAGASGISSVQGFAGDRFSIPDTGGGNPVDAAVAWDALTHAEDGPPRVPAMGMTSEYLVAAPPHVTPPDPEGDKGAYAAWRDAGVPVYQFTIAGSTHFDFSLLPGFPASSWCPDFDGSSCKGGWGAPMIVEYTVAWFDRWLKKTGESGFEDADARLLDDAFWCERYSFYSRSARSFTDRGGKPHLSEDIRADCVAGAVDAPLTVAAAADKSLSPSRFGGALGFALLLPLFGFLSVRRFKKR